MTAQGGGMTELRRGVLGPCVLARLELRPRFGLELVPRPGRSRPHQVRAVRVLWTSTVCLIAGTGSAIGNDELALRMRVGWIVRIEIVPLDQGWYLAGPSHGKDCT